MYSNHFSAFFLLDQLIIIVAEEVSKMKHKVNMLQFDLVDVWNIEILLICFIFDLFGVLI